MAASRGSKGTRPKRAIAYRLKPHAIGLIAVILSVCAVFTFVGKLKHDDRERISSQLQRDAEVLASVIKVDLSARIRSLQRLTGRWQARGGTPKDEFLADAKAYVRDQPGYQALEWVDTDYIVRWIEPLAGNEAAQNLNLGKEEKRRRALEKAKAKGSPTLSQPIDLVQGGKGMLVYFPLLREGQFDGFLLAVFRIESWLSELYSIKHLKELSIAIGGMQARNSLLLDLAKRVNISVYIDNTPVYVSKVGEQLPDLPGAMVDFDFIDQSFGISAMPTQAFIEAHSSELANWVAGLGLGFSVAFGLTVYQLMVAREQRALADQQRKVADGAQQALSATQSHLLASINAMRNGFAIWSPDDELIMANEAYLNLVDPIRDFIKPGLSHDTLLVLFREYDIWQKDETPNEEFYKQQREFRRSAAFTSEERQHADGREIVIERHALNTGSVITVLIDVTDHREREHKLQSVQNELSSNLQILKSTFENFPGGIGVYSQDLILTAANSAFYDSLNLPEEDFPIGTTFEHIMRNRFQQAGYEKDVIESRLKDKIADVRDLKEHRTRHRDRDGTVLEIHKFPIKGAGFITTYMDVTENENLVEELEHIAYYDQLTGLANRASCQRDLTERFADTTDQTGFALVQIDLDNFKKVNDTLGHAAGDHLLRTLGKRLTKLSDDLPGFKPYRWGGDEFLAIVEGYDAVELNIVCEEVTDLVSIQINYEKSILNPTVSLGIARYPEDADSLDALMIFSDLALYKTKELGRDGYQFFTAEMKDKIDREARIEADLRIGIDAGQMLLHYQPQIDLKSGAISGFEALVRWKHPEWGMVSPGAFITIAENTGLGPSLSRQVLKQAMTTAREWHDQNIEFGRIAINLSPQHLKRGNFLEDFFDAMHDTGAKPEHIAVEVLESYLFDDPNSDISNILTLLREQGVWVELDDFGTGYASLSHLSSLPVNGLKIDQSFIRDITRDIKQNGIVSSLISMTKLMGLHVVCEGVETREQFNMLRQFNNCSAQGYFIQKPMDRQSIETWMAYWDPEDFLTSRVRKQRITGAA
jgi:diguanylate cyclase (GGDEF)-like protein